MKKIIEITTNEIKAQFFDITHNFKRIEIA
jgi:hypothetical protein